MTAKEADAVMGRKEGGGRGRGGGEERGGGIRAVGGPFHPSHPPMREKNINISISCMLGR